MKILKILTTNPDTRTFSATLRCEFCLHEQKLCTGFDSDYYHDVIIPNIQCQKCEKQSKHTHIRSN